MPPHYLLSLLTLSLLSSAAVSSTSTSTPDTTPLLFFKAVSDTSDKLPWNTSTHTCTWTGVSCTNNRVSRLVLENLDLSGHVQPLTSLTHLRVLSLKHNRLNGPVPDLSNLTSVKLLFLSFNDFSGDFPASLTTFFRLYRLDLSHNRFSGHIPPSLNRLTHLLTLRLEGNRFNGSISELNLPNLEDFNVSGNNFAGKVPDSLSGFPKSAFQNNLVFCGAPFPSCEKFSSDPTRPGSNGALASPVGPNPSVVASSPSSLPSFTAPSNESANPRRHDTPKISTIAVIAIILGDVLVLGVVSLLLYCYFWRNYGKKSREGKISQLLEGEKILYSTAGQYPMQGGYERGRMVFFEGVRRFELEDLLRASAEMLGKGGFGTAYKAVLDDGDVVAVKRLKEAVVGGKREFEQQMEVLGRLRHPNVVAFKAYYFARDERLLVYDYMTNGSLFWLLHGNRGPGRTPLDWTTRLKFAAGAAHGLSFIHNSNRSIKLVHGNIKSTNILIDKAGNARVSDFGLSSFACPTTAPRSNGYRAPEASDGRKLSQKSDVYSFGVLLLELLTGKCPSMMDYVGVPCSGNGSGAAVDLPRWVQSVVREEWTAEVFDLELMRYKDIEEEMVGLLQIAMACASPSPDQRPRMAYVVKMIEEIRGVEVSPSHETFESDSPAISEDTYGTSQ